MFSCEYCTDASNWYSNLCRHEKSNHKNQIDLLTYLYHISLPPLPLSCLPVSACMLLCINCFRYILFDLFYFIAPDFVYRNYDCDAFCSVLLLDKQLTFMYLVQLFFQSVQIFGKDSLLCWHMSLEHSNLSCH